MTGREGPAGMSSGRAAALSLGAGSLSGTAGTATGYATSAHRPW